MDPVPHLPPSWLMGYRHVGAEVAASGSFSGFWGQKRVKGLS